MSLVVKYRPKKLDDMVGNIHIKEGVKEILAGRNIPKAFLLTGLSGIGKTTLARILALKLGAVKNSIMEINIADLRGVDAARDIVEKSKKKSLLFDKSVYILDEVHQMTEAGQNLLLKVLEEPPEHLFFILCTTENKKLLPTILTRCQIFNFDPLSIKEGIFLINKISKFEGLDFSSEIKKDIVESGGGSARNILKIVESIYSLKDESIIKRIIQNNLLENVDGISSSSKDFYNLFMNQKEWVDYIKMFNELSEKNVDLNYFIIGVKNLCIKDLKKKWDILPMGLLQILNQKNSFNRYDLMLSLAEIFLLGKN